MSTRSRLWAIAAIIVAGYMTAAAALVGLWWLLVTAPDPSDCGVDSCAFNGYTYTGMATFGLEVLIIGMIVSLPIGVVRERRASQATFPPRSAGWGNSLAVEATRAAGWGVVVAIPLSCVLWVPAIQLAFWIGRVTA
jgi:hypothetical protein